MIDYNKFILTPEEQKVFEKFKNSNRAKMNANEFELLFLKGLVEGIYSSGWVNLSRVGKELRTFQKNELSRIKKENTRYYFTTAIAVLALILSLVSLFIKS
ncbi:MAG: hypothetical protein H2212_07215 [Ruminococcus sp.]|nr:hypothetical protein [Ruminococcus sp.]